MVPETYAHFKAAGEEGATLTHRHDLVSRPLLQKGSDGLGLRFVLGQLGGPRGHSFRTGDDGCRVGSRKLCNTQSSLSIETNWTVSHVHEVELKCRGWVEKGGEQMGSDV